MPTTPPVTTMPTMPTTSNVSTMTIMTTMTNVACHAMKQLDQMDQMDQMNQLVEFFTDTYKNQILGYKMACLNSKSIGQTSPGFCDATNLPTTGCAVFDTAVRSIAPKTSGRQVATLATCQTVLASQTQSSKFGELAINTSNGWPGQQVDTDVLNCKRTRYGVYNSSTGQPSTYGGTKLSSAWSMWPTIKADCKQQMANAKYSSGYTGNTPADDFEGMFSQLDGSDDTTVNVAFDFNCRPPDQTWYTKCRQPGFDYIVDDAKLGKKVDQYGTMCAKDPKNINDGKSGIPPGYFSGAQAQASANLGKTAATCDQGGCCVQTSTTDALLLNSRTCQTCQASQTATASLTGKNITFNLTYSQSGKTETSSYLLPYCDTATQKGVAITPASSAGNAQFFADVRECQTGGSMANQCNGITGCQGLNGTALIWSNNQCSQGLSNFDTTTNNPSANCPNYLTLARQAEVESNGCSMPATNVDTAPYVTGTGYYNALSGMQIPEGAWVTLWAKSGVTDGSLSDQLCAPPIDGNSKYMLHLMCGQSTPGSATPGTCDKGSSSRLRADAQLFEVTSDSTTNITQPTNPYIDGVPQPDKDNNCFCSFNNLNNYSHVGVTRGWEGITMGFMPGYYDATCTTGKGACN